jgi:hypothetical protein
MKQHLKKKHINSAVRVEDRTANSALVQEVDNRQERWFNAAVLVGLLALGIHNSIVYFGFQIVPSPDWPGFVEVGKKLLSFQLPTDYKRAPVLGILQVLLSKLLTGQNPELLAGWLLNAIVYPVTGLLLWLVAKKLIGRAAWFFVIIAMLNPQVIDMLKTPLAETVFLFFIVLTFYFIFKRSQWSYFFAAITTMVRYEGAALILAAFVLDVLSSKNKKQWLMALGCAALASVPLGLWMLGTFVNWQAQGSTHYLKELGSASGGKIVFFKYVNTIWSTGFANLFMPSPDVSNETGAALMSVNKLLVGAAFGFGAIYGLYKRRWDILALLIFLVPYVLIHAIEGVVLGRHCMPVLWIVLLICLYGMKSCWGIINQGQRVPKLIVIVCQVLILIPVVIWLISLIDYLPQVLAMSPKSVSVLYVAMAAAVMIFIAGRLLYRARFLWFDTVMLAILCLMVVSNQFSLAYVVKTGRQDAEFKLLADWYAANAKPGEKLLSTMAGTLAIFLPAQKANFIHLSELGAKSPEEFKKRCYEKGITYVVWDSRAAGDPDRRFYNMWGWQNMAALSQPRSIDDFEYITTIRESKDRYLYIFRLKPLGEAGKTVQNPAK